MKMKLILGEKKKKIVKLIGRKHGKFHNTEQQIVHGKRLDWICVAFLRMR